MLHYLTSASLAHLFTHGLIWVSSLDFYTITAEMHFYTFNDLHANMLDGTNVCAFRWMRNGKRDFDFLFEIYSNFFFVYFLFRLFRKIFLSFSLCFDTFSSPFLCFFFIFFSPLVFFLYDFVRFSLYFVLFDEN